MAENHTGQCEVKNSYIQMKSLNRPVDKMTASMTCFLQNMGKVVLFLHK